MLPPPVVPPRAGVSEVDAPRATARVALPNGLDQLALLVVLPLLGQDVDVAVRRLEAILPHPAVRVLEEEDGASELAPTLGHDAVALDADRRPLHGGVGQRRRRRREHASGRAARLRFGRDSDPLLGGLLGAFFLAVGCGPEGDQNTHLTHLLRAWETRAADGFHRTISHPNALQARQALGLDRAHPIPQDALTGQEGLDQRTVVERVLSNVDLPVCE